MIESRYQMLTADAPFHGHSKIVVESGPGLLNVHVQILFLVLKREGKCSTFKICVGYVMANRCITHKLDWS